MSDLNTPMFSYKQYVNDMQKLKQTGTVDSSIQKDAPRSAGSRGLQKIHQFTKEPVHMMGEDTEPVRPGPANPNPNSIIEKNLDVPTPTVPELANKYGVSTKTIIKKLRQGVKVEAEHTTDFNTAMEIALDHLNEKLDYYELLATVEDVVDIDKNFQMDLMKYLNMKMVQIEKQIQDKPAKTPEEKEDKDFAVKLFKFVQQKLAQQDAKNESRDISEGDLVAKRQSFYNILADKIREPQTGMGKTEHDPRILARVWQMLTGEKVEYNPDKDTYIVHKHNKT